MNLYGYVKMSVIGVSAMSMSGHSGKARSQLASERRFKNTLNEESLTSCGSLFHGETTRTVKEFALAAVIAMGFSKVRECNNRLHGGY